MNSQTNEMFGRTLWKLLQHKFKNLKFSLNVMDSTASLFGNEESGWLTINGSRLVVLAFSSKPSKMADLTSTLIEHQDDQCKDEPHIRQRIGLTLIIKSGANIFS